MPDQLHCLKCGHTWFPRYKKKSRLRKCPNCGSYGKYEVLKWWKQGNSKYFGSGKPAGSERLGCGFFIIALLFLILLIFLFL